MQNHRTSLDNFSSGISEEKDEIFPFIKRNTMTIRDLLLSEEEDNTNYEITEKAGHTEVQPFIVPAGGSDLMQDQELLRERHTPFIIANTSEVSLEHLRRDCIIPVFSRDNERTISHQEFITGVEEIARDYFSGLVLSGPEIRVSHQIKGRVPSAIYKDRKELLEAEKTIYYERMAFVFQVENFTKVINGNPLKLTIGGVRSYNDQNLYGKKSLEKFRFFIGYKNMVCCNMCVSTDGLLEDLRVSTIEDLQSRILKVMSDYDAEQHFEELQLLSNYSLTEHQFAQLIGRCRLYHFLANKERKQIPELLFNDSHLNTVAKDYYKDENFNRGEDGTINLWSLYNLFTQANKSSYIDSFLERDLNAFEFCKGIQEALNGSSPYHWFLS